MGHRATHHSNRRLCNEIVKHHSRSPFHAVLQGVFVWIYVAFLHLRAIGRNDYRVLPSLPILT